MLRRIMSITLLFILVASAYASIAPSHGTSRTLTGYSAKHRSSSPIHGRSEFMSSERQRSCSRISCALGRTCCSGYRCVGLSCINTSRCSRTSCGLGQRCCSNYTCSATRCLRTGNCSTVRCGFRSPCCNGYRCSGTQCIFEGSCSTTSCRGSRRCCVGYRCSRSRCVRRWDVFHMWNIWTKMIFARCSVLECEDYAIIGTILCDLFETLAI